MGYLRNEVEKNVIILGGGIAGLAAATELLEKDCRVTILESKERLGGRIHTLSNGGVPIELGAEFIHGENATLDGLISSAGLKTHDVPETNRVFRNGRLEVVPLWQRASEVINAIDPAAPDQSFAEFIEGKHINAFDRELAVAFVQGFNAADAQQIGAHALRRAEFSSKNSDGSKQKRINMGYGALVAALESQVRAQGGNVRLGTGARRVVWKLEHVEVFADPGGGVERFEADAAIVTLPLGVLKSGAVTFEPSLPRKAEAVRDLLFGNARKVALLFREAWWPGGDFGFVHSFAEAIPTWWSHPRAPLLTGWAGGPKADTLAGRSTEDLIGLALEILSRIFGETIPVLRKQLQSMHTYDWRNDPNAAGAYSYIPERGLDLPKVLAEPVENTLFFGGEATAMDAQMGTVFGAVESGLRAAREMIEGAAVHV